MDDRREGKGDDEDRPAAEPGTDDESVADASPDGSTEQPAMGDETTSTEAATVAREPASAPPTAPPTDYWMRPVDWGAVDRALPPPRGTLRIGSVIVRSFDLFLQNPQAFVALALPSTLISVLTSSLTATTGLAMGASNVAIAFPLLLGAGIVGVAMSLATTMAADDARAGRPLVLRALVRRGLSRTIVAILSFIVQFLGIFGIVVGGAIVVGILAATRSAPLVTIGGTTLAAVVVYVFLRWSLASAAIALEPLGPIEAISRSRAVTRGNVRRLFGLFVVLGLVTVPLGIAIGLLSITETDLILTTLLSVLAGLLITPLATIVTTTVFGDLTGRAEEVATARSQGFLAATAGVVLVIGLIVTAYALPKVGPALERLAVQGIPVEDRGKIVAGTIRNPLDECRPGGAKSTFASGESIYIGGYFSKPIPRGQTGSVDFFVNGRHETTEPLSDPLNASVCYYELEPLVGAPPGSYRIAVNLDGETIAKGEFTIR